VDPNKLAAYGLGIDQVEQAVEAGNVNQPLGTLYGKHQAFTVQANGQLKRGGFSPDDCRLSQRQSGAAAAIGQRARQRAKRQSRGVV
jgi:multidrug efflux pump subunit AcrB